MQTDGFRELYLRDIIQTYRSHKTLAERAMAQVSDADLHYMLDGDANSIAIIVKHLAGNLRSRFTDFLTTDGEKPGRNRDGEFEMGEAATRDAIMKWWESSWAIAVRTLESLTPADLDQTITQRGEPFRVVEVLDRLATHTAYHVGQIVLLAKHRAGSNWASLTIPKARSRPSS